MGIGDEGYVEYEYQVAKKIWNAYHQKQKETRK
jgi:hypothetical protein